jgi:hypothetical protein
VEAFHALITNQLSGFTNAVGSGAFMDLFTYEFASLAYLPFALMGVFILMRARKFNFALTWWLVSAVIVYFKLVFYNRFIVYLDIMMIVLAGVAAAQMLTEHRKTTYVLMALVLISMGSIIVPAATKQSHHHISPEEYVFISGIPEITEANSSIISNMVEDAPLLVAYSNRTVIAPGLFGQGKWTLTQWTRYWTADSFGRVDDLMDQYERPLYIYLGEKSQRGDIGKFNSTCLTRIAQQDRMELLRYDC